VGVSESFISHATSDKVTFNYSYNRLIINSFIVDEIYPRDPMDEKIIASEMDKLKYYTLNHPEKLGRIGDYLLSIVDTGLYKGHLRPFKRPNLVKYYFKVKMAGLKCQLMRWSNYSDRITTELIYLFLLISKFVQNY